MKAYDFVILIASSIVGTLGGISVILRFLKDSEAFNPFVKIDKKLKNHDAILNEHEEKIEANKIESIKINTAFEVHQDVFTESQYVILKSLKALLDHEINPNNSDVKKASQDLEDYLLKK